MVIRLNQIEKRVLSVALSGSDLHEEQLRCQIDHLRVLDREMTGVGFFTQIAPIDESLKYVGSNFEITGIEGKSSNLQHGFGCVIFVSDGQINMIECFTFDEQWPDDLGNLTIQRQNSGNPILN